ncbi:MAG: CGNR zinc finger domain-containing protein, partial [Vicinamibacterales bacterium]
RACAAQDCRWWFVDETKNRSRRWCDMKICGNREKLRRFRAKGSSPAKGARS